MLTKKITQLGNSAAIVLPKDILGLMDLVIGDEVELTMMDKTLVVKSISEKNRQEIIKNAADKVFERRKSMLEHLAKGADE
jgi:antitoxin component of MazEF toxin-antitoxin module